MDVMLTEQVLQNVIDNACKHSPSGADIVVSYGVENEKFYYKVRDFGKGIPEDKKEFVFDKYERLKKKDAQIAATGLGLAICKAIMKKQEGDIKVENHPEGGAEFTVWFPISK
jgi:K+-sensing histidine kinase KdpD